MKTTERQNLTVYSLLLILLFLFFFFGSLMWSQHGEYHNHHGLLWSEQGYSQSMSGPFLNK